MASSHRRDIKEVWASSQLQSSSTQPMLTNGKSGGSFSGNSPGNELVSFPQNNHREVVVSAHNENLSRGERFAKKYNMQHFEFSTARYFSANFGGQMGKMLVETYYDEKTCEWNCLFYDPNNLDQGAIKKAPEVSQDQIRQLHNGEFHRRFPGVTVEEIDGPKNPLLTVQKEGQIEMVEGFTQLADSKVRAIENGAGNRKSSVSTSVEIESGNPTKAAGHSAISFFRSHSKAVRGVEIPLSQLKSIVNQAVQEYITWSHQQKPLGKGVQGARGIQGWRTASRHTEAGVAAAQAFANNVSKADNAEEAIQLIDKFLNHYWRFGGKFNTHSCASFLLDKLLTIDNSPWENWRSKVTPRENPTIIPSV